MSLVAINIFADYLWKELWVALLELLNFLAVKMENVKSRPGAATLILDTLALLGYAIDCADIFMATATSVHQLIYELTRSTAILQRQVGILTALGVGDLSALKRLIKISEFYETVIRNANAKTPGSAARALAKDIERDDVHGVEVIEPKLAS
jgi:hypothetical protein